MNTPPPPSWRKPAGILLILLMVSIWVVLIASFADTLAQWPSLVQAAVYLVTGIIWILPLRPLLIWMETGRFRVPRE